MRRNGACLFRFVWPRSLKQDEIRLKNVCDCTRATTIKMFHDYGHENYDLFSNQFIYWVDFFVPQIFRMEANVWSSNLGYNRHRFVLAVRGVCWVRVRAQETSCWVTCKRLIVFCVFSPEQVNFGLRQKTQLFKCFCQTLCVSRVAAFATNS